MFTSFALTNVLNVECWPQILPPLHVCLSEIWKRVNKNYYVFTVQYKLVLFSLTMFLICFTLFVFVRVSVCFCSSVCLFLFEYLSVFVRVSVCFCSSFCLFLFEYLSVFFLQHLSVFIRVSVCFFQYLSVFVWVSIVFLLLYHYSFIVHLCVLLFCVMNSVVRSWVLLFGHEFCCSYRSFVVLIGVLLFL